MPNFDDIKIRPKKGRVNAREREQRLQRIVLIAGSVVTVTVLTLVGTGYYITQYRPLHQSAFKVNDREFDMSYYVAAHKFYGTGQDIIELVQQNELIRQAAEKVGIVVTDEESRAEVESRKIPTSFANVNFLKAELLTNKLLDEYFDAKVPNSTLQRETQAIFLESEKQAKEVRDRIVAGEDFGKLAAELSLDKSTKDASGYLEWHPRGSFAVMLNSAVMDDYIFNAEIGALSEPVADTAKSKTTGYWIAKCAGVSEDGVHILTILAPDEESAKKTIVRLGAGEDFMTVAKEVSQMPGAKDNGGDLGFIKKGDRGGVFDDFAFNNPIKDGDLSQIKRDDNVQTRGGYWLVKVLAEDKDKLLSQLDRNALRNKMYYEWVADLWQDENNKVESFLTDEMKQWAKDASKSS